MATRIKLRRDTAANWTSVNPILASGEMGVEADTRRVKLGDGSTKWTNLKYAVTDELRIDGHTVNTELGVNIASQDPETWINTVKAKANWAGTNGVNYDSQGNVYLSGWEEYGYDNDNANASGKAYLAKFDPQGNTVWTKFVQLDGYCNGGGVGIDSNDNVIVITWDWTNDYFIVSKIDSDGVGIWQKTYRDNYDYADGVTLVVDSEDNIIVGGLRGDENHGDNRALFALKINGYNGNVIWEQTIGGWSANVKQPTLTVDGENNVIIAGWDDIYNDATTYIFKLNSSGTQQWYRSLRNQEDDWNGYALNMGSIDSDESGNIYFVGSYVIPNSITDVNENVYDGRAALVVKINSTGDAIWSRTFGPNEIWDMGAQVKYHQGKLFAVFQIERPYYKNDTDQNDYNGFVTMEIVLASMDADSGQVNWKNKLGTEVLWRSLSPAASPYNYQETENWQGRMIAVRNDYIALAGQGSSYSRIEDNTNRSYGFVAQVPSDGSEMDLASWTYASTDMKTLYAKVKTENFTDLDLNTTNQLEVTGSNEYTPADTDDNFKISLLTAGANQWDFKPNGDLNLPVNGNLNLRRQTDGDINVVGYFDSYNSEGVFNYFNSVTTDPEGNKYYVGIWNAHYNYTSAGNNATPLVVKVNAQGQVEWKSRLTNTYTFGSYGVQGEGTAIGYDPRSGNIVVVAVDSGEGNSDQMLVIDVNTQNGDVVTSKRLRNTGDNDIEPHGLAINTQGERFITGRSQGSNYISFSVNNTMVDPDHHDTLMIPKSVFAGHDAPSLLTNVGDWYIDGVSYMDEVDYYTGITGTVRQGSGASFDVTADGVGGYTVALNQAGVNYRAGHRVLITGDNLGGTTPTNDATVIVDSINSEATGDIATVSIQGISTGSGSYTALTGSNKDVGSGFTIDVQVNSSTGNLVVYYNAGGTNYVDLDQITFPGTSLGGTNPTTNLVIKALDVGMSLGDVQPVEDVGYEVVTRGTSPLTYVRCKFQGNPNLSTGGPWNLYHYTDNNSFLVKLQSPQDYDGSTSAITWAKFIDKQDSDRGVAVDYDSDGNIYWASLCIDEDAVGSDTNYKGRPTVTKLNSSGATQWIKSYDWDGNEGFVTGLQVDSEDKVVISWQNWFGGGYVWRPVIQRMLPNGDKLWGKKIYLDGTEGYTGGLALDSDDNIYVTSTRYNGADEVLWTARLDIQSSDIIWQQDVTREGDDMYLGWYNFTNTIAVDDNKYYLAGLTFDLYGSEGNAIGIALPTDGSAAGNTVGSSPTTGPFAIDEQFYNTEGGGNSPVTRNYTVANWTELVEVNNREPIQAWIETGPTFNYPVYTTSDAGIKFSDGTVQTTSASGLPQVRHNRYSKEFKLKLSDAGRHIYIRNSEQAIIIPTYSEVPFEVGSVITIVNLSGGSLYLKVTPEHQFRTRIYSPQLDGYEGSSPYGYYGYQFQDYNGGNYITLMKLEESYSNGSVWMVTNQGGNVSYW